MFWYGGFCTIETSLDKINENARDLHLLKVPKKYINENESFCKNQDYKSEKVIL